MPPPTIENQTGKPFRYEFNRVLQQMFTGYDRVVIRTELAGGLSGGRVFVVRPINARGAERPSVVKIAEVERIEREWQAYRDCIENRLGDVAGIQGEPTYPRGLSWGGLRYPLVQSGIFDIVSLQQYYRTAAIADIEYVLENRLLQSLETLWKDNRKAEVEYLLRARYDAILPPNLVIAQAAATIQAQVTFLRPEDIGTAVVQAGDAVQLYGFRVIKIDRHEQQLSLNTPEGNPFAYRLEIKDAAGIDAYYVGQTISQPIMGIVQQTRADLLLTQAKKALGDGVDLAAVTLTQAQLPNPLLHLPDILNRSFDVQIGYIHGDLNLENVLVEPQNRNAFLIDFALARQDQILHDPLRMEMAVMTRLLPELFDQVGQIAEQVAAFYERLHCAMQRPQEIHPPTGLEKPFIILQTIRRAAKRHLHRSDDWAEYYHGLILYLLGALRFSDLDDLPTTPLPKQVAFWGAAATLRLLQQQPNCADLIPPPASTQTTSPINTPQPTAAPTNITHFHGPVTGPIHTGSGNIQAGTPQQAETTPPPQLRYHTQKRLALRQILWDHFNLSELQDLCLELAIDFENLPGSAKADKIRELILYGERYGLSEAILQAAYGARPHANWQPFQ